MDDIDPADLISQLKTVPKASKELAQQSERFNISKDEVEDFIIQKSSKLIQDSLELIDNMKEVVHHMPEAENVSSLAELIKASTGAIDTLNKLVVQDKKSNTTIKAKQLDIDSKKELQSADQQHALMLSREEVLERLLQKADVIDVKTKVADPDKITSTP
jgi:predicted RND superfamily exporter protein